MADAARGLTYLHSKGIVHGNVRCSNFLVSAEGKGLISDFGMSKVVKEEIGEMDVPGTQTREGSARWSSPEILRNQVSFPTEACDVFAYGMSILEIITLQWPWKEFRQDAQVIRTLLDLKQRPDRPWEPQYKLWLPGELWDLMNGCWLEKAVARPLMREVLPRIENIATEQRVRRETFVPFDSNLSDLRR